MHTHKNFWDIIFDQGTVENRICNNIVKYYKFCVLKNNLLELDEFFKNVIAFCHHEKYFIKILNQIDIFHKKNDVDIKNLNKLFLYHALNNIKDEKHLRKFIKVFGASSFSECVQTFFIYQTSYNSKENKKFFQLLTFFTQHNWEMTCHDILEIIMIISLKDSVSFQKEGLKFLLSLVDWHKAHTIENKSMSIFEHRLQHYWYPFTTALILNVLKKDKVIHTINLHNNLLQIAIEKNCPELIDLLVKRGIYCSNSYFGENKLLIIDHLDSFYFSTNGMEHYLISLFKKSTLIYNKEIKKLNNYYLFQELVLKIENIHYNKIQERELKKYSKKIKSCLNPLQLL